MQDVLYVVIPAYNEAENIPELVKEWHPVVERHSGGGKSRLLLVNDGSKDSTQAITEELMQKYPLLDLLNKKNGGHGSAVLAGYRYAIAQKADYIFQTDSDRQTTPLEFEGFWEMRKEYDAVFGMRPHREDGAARKMVERVLTILLFIVFHVRLPDANAPFRLMRADVLSEYLAYLPEDYALPNAMLTALFAYFHRNIKFVEISFRPRQKGVNSINIRKIMRIGAKETANFFKIHRNIQKKMAQKRRKDSKA